MTTDQFGNRAIIDPVKLAAFVRSPNGGVFRELLKDGQAVKREAQRLVGVYQPPDAYSAAHRKRRPGTLRDSIVTRITEDAQGPVVFVYTEDKIALWHHEGTRRHVIRPRGGSGVTRDAAGRYHRGGRFISATTAARLQSQGGFLVFFWPKVGHVVRLRSVNHPGTRPNRFLTNALAVLRRR